MAPFTLQGHISRFPLPLLGGVRHHALRPVGGGGEGECRRWRHGEAVIGGGEP